MRWKFSLAFYVSTIVGASIAALAFAQAQATDPTESSQPASAPLASQPAKLDRAAYDQYLWDLAHHSDTLAAFEMMISTNPSEPNPWAWHASRLPIGYDSKKTFDECFVADVQRLYGAGAQQQMDRRLALAKKLDHSLWELFQALVIYNREVFLSREQVAKALADARAAVPQNPTLLSRLALKPVKDPLPPPRSRPQTGG